MNRFQCGFSSEVSKRRDKDDSPELITLARKHGLYLIEETAELNESGMDFQVVFAEDENGISWVLRRLRRPDVIGRGANEGKVLNLVRQHLQNAELQF